MSTQSSIDAAHARGALPPREEYLRLVERTITALEHEDPAVRPADALGLSGGLVRLDPNLPTLIIPDLHARTEFFHAMTLARPLGRLTVLEELEAGNLQVLCLGDGFHSERRGQERWQDAFREYSHEWKKHKAMDAEMRESLALMEMVMQMKCAYRERFHFLKGNHENIMNEEGNGNHPFRKFSFEGEMVKSYVVAFYGEEFLRTYALFERSLPLFAIGGKFLASHAEPQEFYGEDDIVNARVRADVVLGLTWTDNDAATEGSVKRMIEHYLPGGGNAVYFGGHRPVPLRYRFRAGNRYVQIHNPDVNNAALVAPDRDFDPERDMLVIEKEP